ncbi:macro domain-containing protein [Candidatus Woesearchaeota archaeon]|nr:macro domain-containing protein [Candidatus Woesearchaeota archaeon]
MAALDSLDIHFVDTNPEVILELSKQKALERCHFKIGNVFEYKDGSLVSPANSYGDMGDGIDLDYAQYFPGIEKKVQRYIHENHGGQLPIGSAQIVPTNDAKHPYLVVVPTVRKPRDLSSEEDIYHAMTAMLCEVLTFNEKVSDLESRIEPIEKVIVPGLGTGCGGLYPDLSARAIARAYNRVNLAHYSARK